MLRDEVEYGLRREQEAANKYEEQARLYTDLQLRLKEDETNAKIRDAENKQLIAELKQRISMLELKVTVYYLLVKVLKYSFSKKFLESRNGGRRRASKSFH